MNDHRKGQLDEQNAAIATLQVSFSKYAQDVEMARNEVRQFYQVIVLTTISVHEITTKE